MGGPTRSVWCGKAFLSSHLGLHVGFLCTLLLVKLLLLLLLQHPLRCLHIDRLLLSCLKLQRCQHRTWGRRFHRSHSCP